MSEGELAMALYLHIGTHKTGTTSVQRFFARNRKRLASNGVWYPDFGEFGLKPHYAHHDLAHALAGIGGERLDEIGAPKFVEDLVARSREYRHTLLSAEPFWRHVYVASNGFNSSSYWARRRDYVARVADCFAGVEVEVVAVVRAQRPFAMALFSENVKVGRYAQNFARFLKHFDRTMRYGEQLSVWADYFPRLSVFVYEDLRASGDLVRALANVLGLPVGRDWPDAGTLNRSLPADLVEFKRRLNGTTLELESLREIGGLLASQSFQSKMELSRRRACWLPISELDARLERFARGNERVRTRWARIEGRTTLFPEPLGSPGPYWGLSRRVVSQIMSGLRDSAQLGQLSPGLVERVTQYLRSPSFFTVPPA